MKKYEVITKKDLTQAELAKLIDHSLLFPYSTRADILRFCGEMKEYGFGCAAVNPIFLELVAQELKGMDVMIDAPIGYPWGTNTPEIKAAEIEDAVCRGATDIDYVIHIGAAAANDWEHISREAELMARTAQKCGVPSKAILECCYLTDEQKVNAALAVKRAGVDYVKTSTGFGSGWCTVEDVKLLKDAVGTDTGVKAAGKVTTYQFAMDLLHAGASRIGTRAGVDVMKSML